jgi:hypothetical protein
MSCACGRCCRPCWIGRSRESCNYEILERFSFQFILVCSRFHNSLFYSSRTLARWISDIQRIYRNRIDNLLFFHDGYFSRITSEKIMKLFENDTALRQLRSETQEELDALLPSVLRPQGGSFKGEL